MQTHQPPPQIRVDRSWQVTHWVLSRVVASELADVEFCDQFWRLMSFSRTFGTYKQLGILTQGRLLESSLMVQKMVPS